MSVSCPTEASVDLLNQPGLKFNPSNVPICCWVIFGMLISSAFRNEAKLFKDTVPSDKDQEDATKLDLRSKAVGDNVELATPGV